MGPQLTQGLFVLVHVVRHDSGSFPDSGDTTASDGGRLRVRECGVGIDSEQLACRDEVLRNEFGVVLGQRTQLGADLLRQLTAGDPFGDGRALWELRTVVSAITRSAPIYRASATAGIFTPAIATTILPTVIEASTFSPLITTRGSLIAATIETGTPLITTVTSRSLVAARSPIVFARSTILPRTTVTTFAPGTVFAASATTITR